MKELNANNDRRWTVIDKLHNNSTVGSRLSKRSGGVINGGHEHADAWNAALRSMTEELKDVKGIPKPKAMTVAVWRALAYQGVLK